MVSVPFIGQAAETVGKDPNCNDRNCLGVWDGLLADCPHDNIKLLGGGGAGCVSSQDDTPGIFAEPWDYSEATNMDWAEQQKRLIPALEQVILSNKRSDKIRIMLQSGRYTRALITDGNSGEESICEFYFTPNDTTVQFRLASFIPRSNNNNNAAALDPLRIATARSLKNMERAEQIRKELGYLKIPVLRNRQRTLFFVESDLDRFGPTGSAALGPPAEMTTGEWDQRQNVNPNLKIDLLQQFPRTSSSATTTAKAPETPTARFPSND